MKKTERITFWIKGVIILLLLIIVITLLAPSLYMLSAYLTGKYTTIHVYQDENSLNVLLSIISIAVTVWVGLNIYNIVNKNELLEIIEKAYETMDLTNQNSFVSKLRNSFSDHAGIFFAEIISEVEVLPKTLLEELIEFQDLYNNQHTDYVKASMTNNNWTGIQLGKKIIKDITDGKYSIKEQTKIYILGYMNFCMGLLEYSPVQYKEKVSDEEVMRRIRDVINYEKDALNKLFAIGDVNTISEKCTYSPNQRKVISMICNCIGSIYLVAFNYKDRKKYYSQDDINESVTYMELAIYFSDVSVNYIREIFYRNLGSAYMMRGDDNLAYDALVSAYNYNRNNPKISISFVRYYINTIEKQYQGVIENDNKGITINVDTIESKFSSEKDLIIDCLDKALYWYERHFRCGFMGDYYSIKNLTDALLTVTQDELYSMILKMTEREKRCIDFDKE